MPFGKCRPCVPAVVSILVSLWSATAQADEWWGPDKALHLAISAGISASGYALAATFTERRELRVLAGASTALVLSAAKEGYDALGYGDPSWRDFTWDMIGAGVGVALAYAVDHAFSSSSRASSTEFNPSASRIGLRF